MAFTIYFKSNIIAFLFINYQKIPNNIFVMDAIKVITSEKSNFWNMNIYAKYTE